MPTSDTEIIVANSAKRFYDCRVLARTAIFLAALAAQLALNTPSLCGQTTPDPTSLLRAVVEKARQSESSKNRFTYLIQEHEVLFNAKGKQLSGITRLSEILYINDLQYKHLLEVNGKVLTGQALTDEQERYDEAVREHKALDAEARARLLHQNLKVVNFSIGKLLTYYRNRVVEQAFLDGRECLVIDSMPLESMTDAPHRHARIWIDPKKEEMLRLEFDVLSDEGEMLRGSKGSFHFTYIDGLPVEADDHIDYLLTAKNRKSVARIVSDITFRDYRRFFSTSQIIYNAPTDK